MFNRLLSALVLFLAFAQVNAKTTAVEYRFEITDPVHHLAKVTASFPPQSEPLIIAMPAWRSGRYEILDLAKGVANIEARIQGGRQLQVKPLDKSRWKITGGEGKTIEVSYELYANELNYRTRSISEDHAFLDASATFVYAENWRFTPHGVKLKIPAKWQAVSGLAKSKGTFWAPSYDVLVDSPIEMGKIDTYGFSGEKDYLITGWGTALYDYKKLAKDTLKLEQMAKSLWGDFPFERYVFMLHRAPGLRGATEHLNSTVIQTAFTTLDERKDYLRLFSTWVHEYVHTWNVKAYRPKGITPYNYLHENYSNLLWFAEGATSYYDMLLTYRAGVANRQEFLKELTEMVKSYQSRPGVKYKSVAEASFDWWRKHKGSHDHNGSVSIYNEGAMVTLALDHWLRKRTDNQKSIDRLHRRLFELYRIDPTTREGHRGYSEQDIVKILSELSGYDASNVWDRWVNQPSQIDVASLLEYFGLELSADGNSSQLDFGWKLSDDNEFPFVERVLRDGPAWLAGIAAGDRLLAINGHQFNRQYYDLAKNNKWQSTEFEILLLRNEKVHRVQMSAKPGETNQTVIKIAGASEAQKENYRLWTGQPFDEPVENSSEK